MKYEKEFPPFKTKVEGVDKKFNLSDPDERQEYFQAKAGDEIDKLKKYFAEGKTFIAYMLGKKNAGKGTYTKLLSEIFGKDKIAHVSVGDVVRAVHKDLETEEGKEGLIEYLKKDYRGYISIEEGIEAILNRSQDKVSVPNELMMSLIKREIDKHPRMSLFLDGFPRTLDQVSYSLFFKALIDYRQDPDVFVNIDIPESVIDARMKHRVVCPVCQTPRNLMLFATKEAGYDKETKEYFLKCDNTECEKPGTRMGAKEGDNMGIESIRARLEMDDKLADKIFSIHGVPRVFLRNAVPVAQADELVDKYEITPEYYYEYDEVSDSVKNLEKPWVVKDDEGVEVYSLLAPPVVVAFIKQLAKELGL
jgi:adenylate kinase family enzyme